MSKTKVIYYSDSNNKIPFANFLDSLQKNQQVKLLRVITHLEEYGLSAIIPHTKKLIGTPLWEIRVLGKDNLRAVYVIPFQDTVLILHGFSKKVQKTPVKELKIALQYYKDWESRN